MKFPFLDAKARLVRIMGTFDLATGHGDTMDELLDSLESELRDVLGHYREALKKQRTWVGHVDLRYGWNEGDIRALVEALGKVRDGTGLYLCYRPVDVFQDWFLAFMEEAEKQWKKEKNT